MILEYQKKQTNKTGGAFESASHGPSFKRVQAFERNLFGSFSHKDQKISRYARPFSLGYAKRKNPFCGKRPSSQVP